MKKYKWVEPYTIKNNKRLATIQDAKDRAGVYLIKEDNKIVYVGYSGTNLYKTLYRHFQSWIDPTQVRNTYQSKLKRKDYKVRVIFCTQKQAWALEKKLILKYCCPPKRVLYSSFNYFSQE